MSQRRISVVLVAVPLVLVFVVSGAHAHGSVPSSDSRGGATQFDCPACALAKTTAASTVVTVGAVLPLIERFYSPVTTWLCAEDRPDPSDAPRGPPSAN